MERLKVESWSSGLPELLPSLLFTENEPFPAPIIKEGHNPRVLLENFVLGEDFLGHLGALNENEGARAKVMDEEVDLWILLESFMIIVEVIALGVRIDFVTDDKANNR